MLKTAKQTPNRMRKPYLLYPSFTMLFTRLFLPKQDAQPAMMKHKMPLGSISCQ